LVPEVVKPTEWDGGASIVEPTPDPNCVCSASYHYIAKAIDTRGAEIAGEIRGLRREIVDLVTGVNEFLSTVAQQSDANSKRYNDEVKDLLTKIEKSLYVTDAQGKKWAFVDLVMNLINMMSLKI